MGELWSVHSGFPLPLPTSPFFFFSLCSCVGSPQAAVPSGMYLFFHGAPPLTLVLALLFLTLLFLPPFSPQHFLTFLKYVFPEAPYTWLMGSALASSGSVAELTGTGSVQHRAVPDLFPQKPLLQPPNYQNLVIYTPSETKGSNVSLWNKQMLFLEDRLGKKYTLEAYCPTLPLLLSTAIPVLPFRLSSLSQN